MLLYDNAIEAAVPPEYKDISHLVAAPKYQYMFAGSAEKQDDFMLIDLMQPAVEVDLHIEEILTMNEVQKPVIAWIEYTSDIFKKNLDIFCSRYKCRRSLQKVERDGELDWVCVQIDGNILRNDGITRHMRLIIGITRHPLSDIVVSMFKEETLPDEREKQIKQMVKQIRVLDPSIFIP